MLKRPLSVAQRSMLDFERFRPGALSERFTLCLVLRLHGPLDVDRLERALASLVARHEPLRTRLVSAGQAPDGTAYAEVATVDEVPLERVDAEGIEDAALFERLEQLPVDPHSPPLVRAALVRRAAREHLLALCFSHVAADPGSLRIAARELGAAYRALGQGESLPALPWQYGDYAAWQAERRRARAASERQALAREFEGLDPPRYARDVPFVSGRRAAPVERHVPVLDARELSALSAWSWSHRSTLATSLISAFGRAVRADAEGDDLVLSTVFEQRDHPHARAMIGLFLYPTVLRLRVCLDEPPGATLSRARDALLAAHRRAQVPLLEQMQCAPGLIPGGVGLEPCWVRFFQLVPVETGSQEFGELHAEVAHLGGRADPRDLMGLHLGAYSPGDGTGLHAKISYDTHDLQEASALRLVERFRGESLTLLEDAEVCG